MAEVKWIKIVTGIFDDEKIQLIDSMPDADAILVIWFKLLCLAGKCNRNGLLMMSDRIAYTDGMLSAIFHRKESTIKLALTTFEQFGMIEIFDNVITITNWEKHQNVDRLAELREYNRKAQQKHRAKQKQLADVNDKSMTSQSCQETDIDKEVDKENRVVSYDTTLKESKPKKSGFRAPTVEEVAAYCRERKNHVDAEHFVAHYEANGWMVGRNPMKDWKAAVRTWERNGYDKPKKGPNGVELTPDYNGDLDDIF